MTTRAHDESDVEGGAGGLVEGEDRGTGAAEHLLAPGHVIGDTPAGARRHRQRLGHALDGSGQADGDHRHGDPPARVPDGQDDPALGVVLGAPHLAAGLGVGGGPAEPDGVVAVGPHPGQFDALTESVQMQIRDRRGSGESHLVAAQPLVPVDHHRHDPMSAGTQSGGQLPVGGVAGLGAQDPHAALLDPVQSHPRARRRANARARPVQADLRPRDRAPGEDRAHASAGDAALQASRQVAHGPQLAVGDHLHL